MCAAYQLAEESTCARSVSIGNLSWQFQSQSFPCRVKFTILSKILSTPLDKSIYDFIWKYDINHISCQLPLLKLFMIVDTEEGIGFNFIDWGIAFGE